MPSPPAMLYTRRARALGALSALLMTLTLLSANPQDAQAFCGFYVSGADAKLFNNATTVVMMREGTKTVLSMQNNYDGPAQDFAMVVPVPIVMEQENVKTIDRAVFDKVDQMASPRLVEYFEQDPCYQPPPYDERSMVMESSIPMSAPMSDEAPADLGVTIKAKFSVGEYNVLILDAKNSNGLDTWLRQEKYNIPQGAAEVFKPYIQQGMYFFVAKVDIKKVKYEQLGGKSQAVLSPLRFHYDSKDFSLPVRLGLLNANGPQDLIVHILARGVRYEAANYKNVAIPTNLIVDTSVRKTFGEFYAALFDYTLEQNPGSVVTEYSWDANTCDPCPGPVIDYNDLFTLGMDVAQGVRDGARFEPSGGWVLTRLHARYTLKELKDDLVFRAAPGIAGGRGTPQGLEGKLSEEGAVPSGYNNFQGRYIMLNPWKGKIDCAAPTRGVWGGPPSSDLGSGAPMAAQNTAFAPRGSFKLASAVQAEQLPSAQLLPDGPHKITMPTPLKTPTRASSCAATGARRAPTQAPPWTMAALSVLALCALMRRPRQR